MHYTDSLLYVYTSFLLLHYIHFLILCRTYFLLLNIYQVLDHPARLSHYNQDEFASRYIYSLLLIHTVAL